jgi:hypothetical protein
MTAADGNAGFAIPGLAEYGPVPGAAALRIELFGISD